MRTILRRFINNIKPNLKRKKKEKRLSFNMKRQRLMLILRVLLFNIKISLSLPRKSLVLLQISILENNSFLKKRDNIARSLKSRIKSGKMQRRRKLKKRRNKRKKRKGNKRKKRKSKNYLYQLHKWIRLIPKTYLNRTSRKSLLLNIPTICHWKFLRTFLSPKSLKWFLRWMNTKMASSKWMSCTVLVWTVFRLKKSLVQLTSWNMILQLKLSKR